MIRVALLSPYAGDVERNRRYAILAMQDSISRGECPIAPHLLYTQCLDDSDHSQRTLGLALGMAWFDCISYAVIYNDYGISNGMSIEIDALTALGVKFFLREIGCVD